MDIIDVIQLLVPVVTFAMGYFLTSIGYRREKKLSIVREKFEKLYQPFYMLLNELGTEREDGFAFSVGNLSVLNPLVNHLAIHSYLATSEIRELIWQTRAMFVSLESEGRAAGKEKEQLFEESVAKLFEKLLVEYIKSANSLGYDFDNVDAVTSVAEEQTENAQ